MSFPNAWNTPTMVTKHGWVDVTLQIGTMVGKGEPLLNSHLSGNAILEAANDQKKIKNEGNQPRHFCYILECSDGTFYTGWTTDPQRRLKQHNSGNGSRYTRSRLPVKMVYLEPQSDRRAAMKREKAIKAFSRERKKKMIGL